MTKNLFEDKHKARKYINILLILSISEKRLYKALRNL